MSAAKSVFPDGPQDDLRQLAQSRTSGRAKHPDRVIEAMNRVRAATKAPRPTTEVGYCLRECREALQIGPGARDAKAAWLAPGKRYKVEDYDMGRIPAASAVFWQIGVHWHVALAAGQHGYVFSTDILRPGYFDRVSIDTIRQRWGATLLGYRLDLNGVKIR